jgi:hypothetical protein
MQNVPNVFRMFFHQKLKKPNPTFCQTFSSLKEIGAKHCGWLLNKPTSNNYFTFASKQTI